MGGIEKALNSIEIHVCATYAYSEASYIHECITCVHVYNIIIHIHVHIIHIWYIVATVGKFTLHSVVEILIYMHIYFMMMYFYEFNQS